MANATQSMFARILGIVLLIVGLLGFVLSSPLLGLFGVNLVHNLIHVVSGILGILAGFTMMGKYAKTFNVTFGLVYLLVAIVGFAGIAFFTDLLVLNLADNLLHLLIAVASLGVGFGAKD